MPTTHSPSSRLELALEDIRAALREAAVDELARATVGGVIEIFAGLSGTPQAAFWHDGASFVRRETPIVLDAEEMERCEFPGSRAHLAVWLFGPERIARPAAVARWLYRALEPKSALLVASETPWAHKMLAPDEIAEQTAEEFGAMLTRSGFGAFHQVVEGPVFRLWTAIASPASHHVVLGDAEDLLRAGDWLGAQELLYAADVDFAALSEVREYALLVAACHDLAGRAELSVEALEETLRLDPTCTRAMCGLGRIFALEGHLDSAAALFSSALDAEPACEAARRGLEAVRNAQSEIDAAEIAPPVSADDRPALPDSACA